MANGAKRTKAEIGHLHLIQELEARLEIIDAELAVSISRQVEHD